MKTHPTPLPGILIIEPDVYTDPRGLFQETFSQTRYQDLVGIHSPFLQDNHSRSTKNVIRGLHFQKNHPQGKLISVLRGTIIDVTVDINPESPTFGQHLAIELSEDNHRQLWIPPGYAHGFCVTSDIADIIYKCTDYYHRNDEGGLAWNCPVLNIQWPTQQPLLSDKDKHFQGLEQFMNQDSKL